MKTKASQTIDKYSMLKKGEAVLVALSGGADSVALLFVLKELGYEVLACHVNHNLRGEESDSDQLFCEKLCDSLGIILYVESVDVNTFCSNNKLSTEEGARILRYNALEKYSCGMKIATAHTLSDSLETTLFNLARGTSLKGLCGIPPVRGSIVRPLIECTREKIESYLQEKNQPYVIDSTNSEVYYSRNRIRNLIVPELIKINPSLFKNYHKTITSVYYDNQYLEKKSVELIDKAEVSLGEYSADILMKEDMAVLSRAVAIIIQRAGCEVNSERISSVIEILKSDGKINIGKNVYAVSKRSKLSIKSGVAVALPFEFELIPDEEYEISGKKVNFDLKKVNLSCETANVNKKFAKYTFDYDKIQGKAVIRNRRDGDRIRFARREHTTSIKKLFNRDIPIEKRDEIIFLCDEKGVIFVEEYGIADRVCCDENTARFLTVKIDLRE